MKPTEGRVVWYQPRGAKDRRPQAAIIAECDPNQGFRSATGHEENELGVYLAVFTRSCVTFPGLVRFHPDGEPGTWRWPAREQAARQTILPPSPASS